MTTNKIPELQSVESSALKAMGYDPAAQTLFIQFPSGNVYAYTDVSTDTWAAFQAAESKGKFYGTNINGKYVGAPVKPTEPAASTESAS